MSFGMDDEEIFGTHYFNIKALVNISGKHLKKEIYLLRKLDLTDQQLRRLNEILDNRKHPWMIDYYNGSSFVETNPEASRTKGPGKIILITIAVIFTGSFLVGIYTALRDEFDVTTVDYAKFILGLGTVLGVAAGVGFLTRKLPIFKLWKTLIGWIAIPIGCLILITQYNDFGPLIFIPWIGLWALGDLLLSVFS